MKAIKCLCIFILCSLFICGSYWIAKHVSYWAFYEEMVQDTIVEQVRYDCLRRIK